MKTKNKDKETKKHYLTQIILLLIDIFAKPSNLIPSKKPPTFSIF
jgi:hypothetical protein